MLVRTRLNRLLSHFSKRNYHMRRFVPFIAIALAACSSSNTIPISANPISEANGAAQNTQIGQTVDAGLLNAEWNLDQAIVVGALPATDPADACMHSALTQ